MQIKMPTPPNLRTREGWKSVVSGAVGFCVTATVTMLVRQNIDTDDSALKGAEVYVGSLAIGAMVADASRGQTDALVDHVADAIAEAKEEDDTIHVESTREE